jgi:VRR-NUC domain
VNGAARTRAASRASHVTGETESQFQQALIEAAHVLGWKVAHFRPARTAHGWRTPVEADGAGFPDVVLVRERVVFAELKAEKTRVTRDQGRWLDALADAGAEVFLWRPSDWEEIERVLRGRSR